MAACRVASVAAPPVAPGEELGAADADHQDGSAQVLDEVGQQLQRVVVGPLQVVEHQDERVGALARVGLGERLDDGAAHRAKLLRVALDGADQRRVLELEIEQLPEEVRHVADLAVLEHRRHLRAHLSLGRLGVHALDDAEPGAQHPREDLVGGAALASAAAEDARRVAGLA